MGTGGRPRKPIATGTELSAAIDRSTVSPESLLSPHPSPYLDFSSSVLSASSVVGFLQSCFRTVVVVQAVLAGIGGVYRVIPAVAVEIRITSFKSNGVFVDPTADGRIIPPIQIVLKPRRHLLRESIVDPRERPCPDRPQPVLQFDVPAEGPEARGSRLPNALSHLQQSQKRVPVWGQRRAPDQLSLDNTRL